MQGNSTQDDTKMLSLRDIKMGWSFSLAIFCLVVVLTPGSHASYDPKRGAIVGMVSIPDDMLAASLPNHIKSKSIVTNFLVRIF